MKRSKKLIFLSAALALVLAVQASGIILSHSDKDYSATVVDATRTVMDAKPESTIQIIKVARAVKDNANGQKTTEPIKAPSMPQVTAPIEHDDVEKLPDNVKLLTEEEAKKLSEIAQDKVDEAGLTAEQGEIIFIPAETLSDKTEIKNLGLGIAYDPSAGLLYGVDEHGLLYIGFDYDFNQKIFYNPKYPWQRNFGFCELYDACAPATLMFYDTQRFKFEYAKKDWMIQVWKGQYGLCSGAEIGVYTKSPKNPIEFYDCASDEDCLEMSFDLYKNGKVFFSRESESHWWLTGFAPLTTTAAEDFEMRAKITMKDGKMAAAFVGALKENGYILGKTYWIKGNVVSFNW